MPRLQQNGLRNRLLRALDPADFERLAAHLEPVDLVLREVLIEPDTPIAHLHFVEEGIVSIIAQTIDERVEVGMVGPEGLGGVSILLGTDRSPNLLIVQATGSTLRVPAAIVRAAFDESRGFRDVLLRYVQCLMIQMSRTTYANARFGIESRLARWILMTHDRLGSDELPLTHEFLSMMLGTRRSSITTATHVLEGNGLIRAKRANIVVLDRAKLEELAGDSYGAAEAEYERLFGSPAAA
ncbi:CarD family transcriptional regulator [Aureimonas sp. Leaf454]|uniref:Crp/Fnr family transcriptional regulator n=1 Tax=Aureimonas sp. Leaf454 TaxID=1736381 RepID=UPI0006F4C484|nr:Crp/Fnr family transcriptional regulator [Aureimonas sp. Leaf454]KQT46266.1 CarD family transcriptional regulator [Aureimonas sp. Leaf454]